MIVAEGTAYLPSIMGQSSLPVRSRQQAFTLVEIALALGIFAFAIIAIMGLFPIGLRSANDSRVETIVTQIARTVLSDLRTGDFNAARVVVAPLPAANITPDSNQIKTYDLSQDPPPFPLFVLYSAKGEPIREIGGQAGFDSPQPGGDFAVKIESKLKVSTPPVLAQVTVTVESPASAPSANRTEYSVVTLMGDTR